jgi:endoglucanase
MLKTSLKAFKALVTLSAILTSCRPTPASQIQTSGATQESSTEVVNGFLVAPNTAAKSAAQSLRSQNHPDAKLMELVARNTVGVWYGAWSGDIGSAVKSHANKAISNNAIAVMIPYNIPYRDCGSHSAGGIPAGEYRTWISQFATAVGLAKAYIVLEPDALALTECLSAQALSERFELLRYAVKVFKDKAPNAKVYIDAGHPAWLSPEKAADRLKMAGVDMAAGFALNTSNYFDNKRVVDYGSRIRSQVKKNFIVDTSRNGRGSSGDNDWCNPSGRGLGTSPTAKTNTPGVDAFLWIKAPGESDGNCGGGPSAGSFWQARALELARNANLKVPNQSTAQKSDDEVVVTPEEEPSTTTLPAPTLPAPNAPAPSPRPTPAPRPTPSTIPAPAPAPAPQPLPAPAPKALPAPQPLPAPAPSSGGSSLEASINIKSQWQGGYCADVIVSNRGSESVSSWTLVLNLNGTRLAQQWNVNVSANGDSVTFRPVADWNARIAPGSSVNQQGFCVDTSSDTSANASVTSVY